jgi:hypothetical protein
MIIFIPLRVLAGAPEASPTTFLTFFTSSASRSGTEAVVQLVFSRLDDEGFRNRRGFTYPCAFSSQDPLPLRQDVNGGIFLGFGEKL